MANLGHDSSGRRTEPHTGAPPRLGDLLVNEGVLTRHELDEAITVQRRDGGFLGQILVQMGFVKQADVASCLVKQCKIPHLSLLDYNISSDVLSLVPKEVCLKHHLIPIDRLGRILTVAMVDPLDLNALEEVRGLCPELRIKPILCNWQHFELVAKRALGLSGESPGGKSRDMTMESLGLVGMTAPRPVQAEEPPAPAQAPPPPGHAPAPVFRAETPAAPQAPAISTADLAAAMRGTFQELGESMRGAMTESLGAIASEIRNSLAAQPGTPQAEPALNPLNMAELVREGVSGAMQEALAVMVVQLRSEMSKVIKSSEQLAVPPEQMLAAVREGIGGALEESMAHMMVQLRSTLGQQSGASVTPETLASAFSGLREELTAALQSRAAPAQPAGLTPEAFTAALGNVREDLVAGLREALESSHTREQSRMNEVLAAIRESVRAAQSAGSSNPDQMAAALREAMGSVRIGKEELTAEALAAALRDTLGSSQAAEQQQIAELIVAVREGMNRASASAITPGALAAAVNEALAPVQAAESAKITELASVMRQSIEQSRATAVTPAALADAVQASLAPAQAAEQAHLAELVEIVRAATQKTSRLVETSLVQENTRRGLEGERRRRMSAVTPFGGTETADERDEDAAVFEALAAEQPSPAFTLMNFHAGAANEFTRKLSEAVAREPGTKYNPYFLHGNVGVGKTHLISAIGNKIHEVNPNIRVGYVSASHFARRLADAIREEALDTFRESYCRWEVLILDDIQFLGGRIEAQEEFFHIFNVLHHGGRQIIIASDKAPGHLGLMEQRLVSRFSSGVVAELRPPEWEARMAILRHCAAQQEVPVPETVLTLIAMRVPEDVRKMTGALRKIAAHGALLGSPVSCESAESILRQLGAEFAA